MARSELVEKYQGLVEKYDLLRQRIDKANEQKGRFKNAVVERVIADYERQMKELEEQLAPCENEVQQLVTGLEADRARVAAEKTQLDERRDEMELRNLLGEFEPGEYESAAEKLETDLRDVGQRMEALDEELNAYRELLKKGGAGERRKVVQAPAASVPTAAARASTSPPAQPSNPRIDPRPDVTPPAPPAPVAPPPPAPPRVPSSPSVAAASSTAPPANGAAPLWSSSPLETSGGAASGQGVFGDAFGDSGKADGGNAFEMILDDFPMTADSGAGQALPPLNGGGMDALGGLTELDNQWQKDLADDFPPASGFHDVLDPGAPGALNDQDFPNLGFGDRVEDLPPLDLSAAPRTAYLIRRENRPDEDRYEIRDDVTSIGRGRDNQIQIKDDTKVSRYHCRILREPGGYFVEDNNSSNGTMVNGELITRRKVEGGEDVTIGETVFKFQLR